MVNSVFSSLPTFYMCTLRLPSSVIKHIDKYMKHCMWRGAGTNAKNPPQTALTAWRLTCRPKIQGGLGILKLATHNESLLMKNLHKLFNTHKLPWVSLVWNNHYKSGIVPSSKKVGVLLVERCAKNSKYIQRNLQSNYWGWSYCSIMVWVRCVRH